MAHHAPQRGAQLARRVFAVDEPDDTLAALQGIACLKAFYRSIGLPVTFAQLGIDHPDIPLLVAKLHENKGPEIGGYYRLTPADTAEIYRLAL